MLKTHMNPYEVSEEQLNFFHENGYLLLKNVWNEEEIDIIRRDLDEVVIESSASVAMGTFYENLTSLLFGGLTRTSQKVRDFAGEDVIPDVVNFRTREIFEAKAAHRSHTCNVTYTQLEGYEALQSGHPDYSIKFVIYRHGEVIEVA